MIKTIQEAAQFYIDHGYRPMPIYPVEAGCQHRPYIEGRNCNDQCHGKVPMEDNWPDKDFFFPEDFEDGCNIALIMGKQLDGRWLVGIDIDGPLNMDDVNFTLPPTLECKTARGRHLIYQVRPDTPLGNWTDVFGTRSKETGYKMNRNGESYNGAVDLKYCRGAMVSPPSKSKHGSLYEWEAWQDPTFLPEDLVRQLIRTHKYRYPNVKNYSRWSRYPNHKGQQP